MNLQWLPKHRKEFQTDQYIPGTGNIIPGHTHTALKPHFYITYYITEQQFGHVFHL